MQEACYQLKNKELGFNNYRLMFEELPLEELLREGRRWAGWVYEITSWVWGITAWGSQMSRLSLWNHRNYRLRNYPEIKKLKMQDEWQFCLGLHPHPGGRPLFISGCKFRNDWACSKHIKVSFCTSRILPRLNLDHMWMPTD